MSHNQFSISNIKNWFHEFPGQQNSTSSISKTFTDRLFIRLSASEEACVIRKNSSATSRCLIGWIVPGRRSECRFKVFNWLAIFVLDHNLTVLAYVRYYISGYSDENYFTFLIPSCLCLCLFLSSLLFNSLVLVYCLNIVLVMFILVLVTLCLFLLVL